MTPIIARLRLNSQWRWCVSRGWTQTFAPFRYNIIIYYRHVYIEHSIGRAGAQSDKNSSLIITAVIRYKLYDIITTTTIVIIIIIGTGWQVAGWYIGARRSAYLYKVVISIFAFAFSFAPKHTFKYHICILHHRVTFTNAKRRIVAPITILNLACFFFVFHQITYKNT